MGRLLALGILGTLACAQVVAAQTGSVTGTITTTAKGAAPVRVTIDQKICGNELPDEAIVVDAQGRPGKRGGDPHRREARRQS